jgi:capsular polysaccharide biosynthesis protein
MEPIDYLRAPLRRWPVLVAITIFVVVLAAVLPMSAANHYPSNMWKAYAQIGLVPKDASNTLGSKVGVKQLKYYASQPAVLEAAEKAVGLAPNSAAESDVVISKLKNQKRKKGILNLAVVRPTKTQSATLTNAFVSALGEDITKQLNTQYLAAVVKQQNTISNLQAALAALAKPHIPTTTTTTTSTSTTTTTTVPKKKKKKKKTTATTTTTSSSTTTTTTTAQSLGQLGNTRPDSAGVVTLTALNQTNTTTTTTLPFSVTTTTAAVGAKDKAEERRVLADNLAQQIANLQVLKAAGPPVSGYTIVSPSQASSAVLVPGGSPPLLDNGWIRELLGLLFGAILGLGATYLLEGLDRRIRSPERAAEVFGLPVAAEIPGLAPALTRTPPPPPVVDVVVQPYSATAEAYRKLHVAIRIAPLVTWVKRGGASIEDMWSMMGQLQMQREGVAGEGGDPTAPATSSLALVKRNQVKQPDRFAILVTSPRDEPTRSLVVANLAAVFAEAGDRVLVVTTAGLRTAIAFNERPWVTPGSPGQDLDVETILAHARPSQLPGVSSLALGQLFSSPSQLALKSHDLVRAARDMVDVLLLEAPLLSTQDGEALLPAADVVVVVCECWHTTVPDGVRSQRLLAQHRPPVLGLAVTNVAPPGLPLFMRGQQLVPPTNGGNGNRGGPRRPVGSNPPGSGAEPTQPQPDPAHSDPTEVAEDPDDITGIHPVVPPEDRPQPDAGWSPGPSSPSAADPTGKIFLPLTSTEDDPTAPPDNPTIQIDRQPPTP